MRISYKVKHFFTAKNNRATRNHWRNGTAGELNRSFSAGGLEDPQLIFQSNHLVVANKPPGWQSVVMGHAPNHEQCLLTYLQRVERAGGGSDKSFLLPLHRLDQPCSGVQMYGKTRKAATRIQPQWENIQKQYLIAVQKESLTSLMDQSVAVEPFNNDFSDWMELRALMPRHRRQQGESSPIERFPALQVHNKPRGWSVVMLPWTEKDRLDAEGAKYRECSLQWRMVLPQRSSPVHGPVAFLEVKTNQGAKHMIRAAFSCVGSPLVGDVRYGASQPLPDRSVALHARRMVLPEDRIKLNLSQREFVAPLPPLWTQFFKLSESDALRIRI